MDELLTSHNSSRTHLDRVAGNKQPTITKSAIAVNAIRQQAKKDKTHYCSTCDKSFNNDWSLQRHLATSLHAERLAKSTAESADTS